MTGNPVHAYIDRQYMIKDTYEVFHYLEQGERNVELHHHDYYELLFFIGGDVDFYIDGEIYDLKPGDLVMLNTRALHQAKTKQNGESYERIVLWINKNYLDAFSTDALNINQCFESENRESAVHTDSETRREIQSILNRILQLENFAGEGGDILGKAYVMELIVKIHNNMKDKMKREADQRNDYMKNSALIDAVIEYIEHNLDENINLDGLSERFFISKFHLSREFKKYTDVTIHRYIKLKRLIKAKEQILRNERIIDVCLECGFSDYSNFFRVFKKEYNMTPKQFYKKMATH